MEMWCEVTLSGPALVATVGRTDGKINAELYKTHIHSSLPFPFLPLFHLILLCCNQHFYLILKVLIFKVSKVKALIMQSVVS